MYGRSEEYHYVVFLFIKTEIIIGAKFAEDRMKGENTLIGILLSVLGIIYRISVR